MIDTLRFKAVAAQAARPRRYGFANDRGTVCLIDDRFERQEVRALNDNRYPFTRLQHMTDATQQAIPHGFTQLTEGRIPTTDIISGESGGWAIPHVFLVGRDIGEDGRRIARPQVKKPSSQLSSSER